MLLPADYPTNAKPQPFSQEPITITIEIAKQARSEAVASIERYLAPAVAVHSMSSLSCNLSMDFVMVQVLRAITATPARIFAHVWFRLNI